MGFSTQMDPFLLRGGVSSTDAREREVRVSLKHLGLCNGSRRMRKLLFLFYVLLVKKLSSENRGMGRT